MKESPARSPATELPIDRFYAACEHAPARIAVETATERFDYRELRARVDALAAAFQALDPEPRSRVGICAANHLDHLLALLAVMAAGKTWVPLNPLDAPPETRAKIDAAQPTLVVADAEHRDRVEHADARIIASGGVDSEVAKLVARHAGERPRREPASPEDTQALKFTGGSSGRPKGVLQPYRAWLAGAEAMTHLFGFGPGDRYLIAAPLTHGTSCYVTPVLAAGGTLVLLGERARPGPIIDAFRTRAVTATFLPPTLIYMVVGELDGAPAAASALRLLIYGGASMPVARVREAQDAFGPVVATNYGLTEAPQVITALAPEDMLDDRRVSSVGRPAPVTEVAIAGAGGGLAAAGERGEVLVRGDLVMSGYLDMPEETAATLAGGWLHTGDVGEIDDDGFLYLKDRMRDVIISGGFNVYPSDVEAALASHPAVHECVVFGVPHEKWGEAVHVAVQLRAGAQATEAELTSHMRERVGPVKTPKVVHLVADLPRSAVGKVQRREVREHFVAPG